MTDESKPKIENLELNKETLQDLSETGTEQAMGGAVAGGPVQMKTQLNGTCTCPAVG
jgi:hypothetical protein